MNIADQFINRGNQHLQNGKFKQAIGGYNEAIRINPDDADVYYTRGISKDKIGDYKGAIEDFSQAIRLQPEFAQAYNNRGLSKDNLKNYRGAIEDYSEAIKIKPDNAGAYYNRAQSKNILQDYIGAIKDFSQAIRIMPNYVDAFNDRGNSKIQLQDYKGAIEDYSQAIRIMPDFAGAYNNRGNCKLYMQDYKGAIEDYNKSIRIMPDYSGSYYNRGNCKKNIQDYEGAIEDYNHAIKLQPGDADAYHNRGFSKKNLQNYQGAIEDYNQAIKIRPNYVEAYHNRGNSKKYLQDFKGAQSDYLQAQSLSPQPNPLHLFNLANLYLNMGMRDEALQRYNQGAKIFQTETQANLKSKFKLVDGNISHIKSSIKNFEKISKQIEQINQQAQKQGRKDIKQKIIKIRTSIVSTYIKSTDDNADQQQILNEMKAMRLQIQYLKKRLGIVQEEMNELKSKVTQLEKKIYTEERINNMIEKIDSRKMSDFYKILYNILINHFMAYRMLSTGFFTENVREVTSFDSIAGSVCKAQSIVQSIPILGDLVGIPFQILNFVREEKSSRLNSVIADKINGSRLQSEALITFYMSHLIQVLMTNKPFNEKLETAIKEEEKGFLNQVMDVFGQLKEKIYSKVFGGSSGDYSYAQKMATLYVTRFTLLLYEANSEQFSRHCKTEETFTVFFMECFEDKDKDKKQTKVTNKKAEQPVNDSLKQPWIANNFEVEEQSQPQICCHSFLRRFCFC